MEDLAPDSLRPAAFCWGKPPELHGSWLGVDHGLLKPKGKHMQNSRQISPCSVCMAGFREIEVPNTSRGFLLLSSVVPPAGFQNCHVVWNCAIKYMDYTCHVLIAFALFAKPQVSQFGFLASCVNLGKSLHSELQFLPL